ncbi:hypothetical protein B0H13DRAFT_1873187 [Mycena leptocephala]|nr:hypothetical protein B0H13DRAFT_1873187 [Mycena leptocephala]
MGPRADSPGDSGSESNSSDIPENAPNSFSKPETNHALDFLLKDPSQYLSGNGFKTKACTDISASLKKKFPARPIHSKENVGNRLRYVIMRVCRKTEFEDYEFVRGKSGVGWDDELKKATQRPTSLKSSSRNTEINTPNASKTLPYYNRLAQLFGGNKATSAHVLHLTKPKKSKSCSTSTPSSASTSKRKRQPLDNLDNETIDNDSDSTDTGVKQPPSPKPYDDELLPAPAKHPRSSDTIIGVDNEDDTSENEHQRRRRVMRATATAAVRSQPARALAVVGMSAPLVTKADTSHVDAIVDVFLADPTLLPADPEGEYYALFLDALSANEMRRACSSRAEPYSAHRLAEACVDREGVDMPFSWV